MICDTTFVSDLLVERRGGKLGPANAFLAANRKQKFRVSIITAGEVLLMFDNVSAGWRWLDPWTTYRLHTGIVDAAVEIDREQIRKGRRLGENDNWIAGFARYYREPLISRDKAFDNVKSIRRLNY